MGKAAGTIAKWMGALVAVLVAAVIGFRIYDTQRGPPLEPWHTFIPHELSVAEIDRADWAGYLKAENEVLAAVRANVTDQLPPEDRVPVNRYFDASPIYPPHFAQDWNRSFVLEPERPPEGVAVMLHGLTDSPYSLRHLAQHYRARGFLAIAIRLPDHGTVPGALTQARWERWLAATRLAVREARRRVPSPMPLHLVGYSNGGALALKYALDALDDSDQPRPDRIVLMSPMIGITAFARFAGLAGLPAVFPAFAKTAWLSILPEFNPFKYNSFPVNGAVQSYELTRALQQTIAARARDGALSSLPPVLTFQSVLDFTVSTPAILSSFYARLSENGSEIVLFDINRAAKLGLLFKDAASTALDRLLPPAPRTYRSTLVTNAADDTLAMVEHTTEAGAVAETTRGLGVSYPADIFSLSHIALPFPPDDALYGTHPTDKESFGVRLGNVVPRGERGALIVGLDTLLRISSNPFYDYVEARIDAAIKPDTGSGRAARSDDEAGAPAQGPQPTASRALPSDAAPRSAEPLPLPGASTNEGPISGP